MPHPSSDPTIVTPEVLRGWQLPEPTGDKNKRGSILVIGGSSETLGAVLLAAEAAMRAGAGKLQVATVASVAPFAAAALPEALVRSLPETDTGAISADAADAVRDLAESADAVLIGPGMADKEVTQEFGARLLPHLLGPLALDALGLACVTADNTCLHHLGGRVVLTPNPLELAYALHVEQDELAESADAVLIGPGMADKEVTQEFGARLLPHLLGPLALDALGLACVTADNGCLHHLGGRVVLTPNPLELAYALHVEQDELAEDPAAGAADLAARAQAVVGLGGVTSWVAGPDGALWRDDSGAAGLGVSGSGDVRAGITGGLLARGADPAQAAVWAAFVHGRCGERLSSTVGRLGFLARELPPEIPRALAEITG